MNELIELLQQPQTVPYLQALRQYCEQHDIIDISRGQRHLHSIVNDLHFRDLINALGREESRATTLNFHNQILQPPTLRELTEMLNESATITSINQNGNPLTIINRNTQHWEFDEATRDITLAGINEEEPGVPDA